MRHTNSKIHTADFHIHLKKFGSGLNHSERQTMNLNNDELQFLTEVNTMAQDPSTLKHLIHDKEIVNRIIELSNKYGKAELHEAIKKVKEAT